VRTYARIELHISRPLNYFSRTIIRSDPDTTNGDFNVNLIRCHPELLRSRHLLVQCLAPVKTILTTFIILFRQYIGQKCHLLTSYRCDNFHGTYFRNETNRDDWVEFIQHFAADAFINV
jgi:hypothetical protein